ncbi:PA2169 family four-helix-bundle protein [Olleya sp. YS]|uniref:ferritin-like domain-containing protein n=1 Tax=Olleya sp. YS TaxID=3028318 RepID=UPI00243434B7|nr:PA2169 family four-helix-bundle protein [Olleya sp. YS]WGD35516.1 PA2169 family four-helix-bundle protein [Olleya sp. YS]
MIKDIMKYTEEISKKLNELLIKNYDAEKGYLNAVDNVDNDRLKMFFKRRASERSEFAKELRTEILQYGQIPEDSGSFKGAMHRNWMTLKSTFSSNNEEAILEEAIRGEEASLETYDELMKENDLPPTIDSLLMKHRNAIQAAINTEKVHEELVS